MLRADGFNDDVPCFDCDVSSAGRHALIKRKHDVGSRIHELAVDTYDRAAELPYAEMISSADDSLYGSLVTFRIKLPESKIEKLWQLCEERLIWTTGNPNLRISTHIHTRRSDLDLFFETLAEVAA